MKRILVWLPLILTLLLALAGCNSGIPATSPGKPAQTPILGTTPLTWLLQAVSQDTSSYITYHDVRTISAFQKQTIPPREASMQEKAAWWTAIQQYAIAGHSFPTSPEIWGFDDVDQEGSLWIYLGPQQLSLVMGKLDTMAFREKMKSYQYIEEDYLGYPVISGTPHYPEPNYHMDDLLPRAYGVIDGIPTNSGAMNLVIIPERRDDYLLLEDEVGEVKTAIQSVIKAYHDKTSLAYQTGGITTLASRMETVGSAILANPNDLQFDEWLDLKGLSPQQLKEEKAFYIGPGTLSPYSQVAFTQTKVGSDRIIKFILTYSDSTTARKNVPVLEERLKSGHSLLWNKPLTDYWTVQEVTTDGSYLEATVRINEPQPKDGTGYSVGISVFTGDYWFLYPD